MSDSDRLRELLTAANVKYGTQDTGNKQRTFWGRPEHDRTKFIESGSGTPLHSTHLETVNPTPEQAMLLVSDREKNKKTFPVVTLCGSTRFKREFLEVQKQLSLAGNIVISVGLFGHSGDDEVWQEGTKEMLDDMHKHKIDLADEIYVIDVDGYIGESTRSEIEYASAYGKKVHYLSQDTEMLALIENALKNSDRETR